MRFPVSEKLVDEIGLEERDQAAKPRPFQAPAPDLAGLGDEQAIRPDIERGAVEIEEAPAVGDQRDFM